MGTLTTTILAVVGIDDVFAIVIYVFVSTFIKGMLHHEAIHIVNIVGSVGLELSIALIIGSLVGFTAQYFLKKAKNSEEILFLVAIAVLTGSGLAHRFHTSQLLTNMCCGITVVNLYPSIKNRISQSLSGLVPLFYAMFFIIGGGIFGY